jgi:hypothetical protein
LRAKHKLVWPAAKRFPEASLYEVLGLVCLAKADEQFPVADILTLSPRAGRRNPHIRFDDRGVKTKAWSSS